MPNPSALRLVGTSKLGRIHCTVPPAGSGATERPIVETTVGSNDAPCDVGHDSATHFTEGLEVCDVPPEESFACSNVDVAPALLPGTSFDEAKCSGIVKTLTTGTNIISEGPDVIAGTNDKEGTKSTA